jgi:acyl carrier protein
MNEQQLRDVVTGALTQVAPEIDTGALDPAADLSEQLDLDSMDFLNVIVAIHEQTGIEIPERDYPKLAALDDAVAYLAAAQQHGAAGPPG